MVIVPDAVKPGEKLPVVFLWHWLGGSASSFYNIVDGQNAVNAERFIAVIPEAIGGGISKWRGWAATNPQSMEDEEAVFFDDMLSCVSAQFPVNKNCVSSAGVSDGALWTSQLIGVRADYLASAVVLSGGVGDPGDANSALVKPYVPASRPIPVLVLWGGACDICIILKFQIATKALERHLQAEGHFILECQHNCGHSVPPIDVPPGKSLLSPFTDFIQHHPYWTTAGHSPYETSGLPAGLPSWCAIGAGNAVERTGACPAGLGCPVNTTCAADGG
jgi:predicted esterase